MALVAFGLQVVTTTGNQAYFFFTIVLILKIHYKIIVSYSVFWLIVSNFTFI